MKKKQYVSIIDGGGKYEVLNKTETITTILKDGIVFNIPNVYVIDYDIWVKKNKPKSKSKKNI